MKVHWDEMRRLAVAHQLTDAGASIVALRHFLEFWWCRHYNRPFKDPLLKDYSLDDLIYEFLRIFYSYAENDPVKLKEKEDQKAKEDEWIMREIESINSLKAQAIQAVQKISPQAALAANPTPAEPVPALPDLSIKLDE